MRSEWQMYKEKQIFYCDYTRIGVEELQAEMDEVDAFIGKQPEASVLMLTDVQGLIGSPKVVEMFKKSSAHTKKYLSRSAVIGIGFSGPKKILFDLVMRVSGANVNLFDDAQKAKDWLVAN